MENSSGFKFEVGQLAESKSFKDGYRGAWFRCKIKHINLKRNKIQLEYYDFDVEEISWEQIFEQPPYGRKTRHIKRQLMVRPRYPLTYKKDEMPDANSIPEVCVVFDGTFKVDDKVDWNYEGVYWSARVVEVLSDDKVKIELPMPPAGEGVEGETYEALCKDLRPYLDWSERNGWTLPTLGGRTSCGAQLIFPSKQGMNQESISLGSPLNASSSTRLSAEGDTERQNSGHVDTVICDDKMVDDLAEGHAERQSSNPVNAVVLDEKVASEDVKMVDDDDDVHANTETQSSVPVNCEEKVQAEDAILGDTETHNSNLMDTVVCEEKKQTEDVKMDDECVESFDSITSLRVEEKKSAAEAAPAVADEGGIHFSKDLNIKHEDTLEAAVIDLEELVNKIKWMQNLLNNNGSQSSTDSTLWKFV
ncbi:uncharacterized protein [Rutidosis leptorrhynchoides]|uniref:uncharacterized protein isoform X1 n=1 Tax=Rutidosis leptorrhynchoides TaxID=125765 RepID=UPI003A9902FA